MQPLFLSWWWQIKHSDAPSEGNTHTRYLRFIRSLPHPCPAAHRYVWSVTLPVCGLVFVPQSESVPLESKEGFCILSCPCGCVSKIQWILVSGSSYIHRFKIGTLVAVVIRECLSQCTDENTYQSAPKVLSFDTMFPVPVFVLQIDTARTALPFHLKAAAKIKNLSSHSSPDISNQTKQRMCCAAKAVHGFKGGRLRGRLN